MRMRIVRVLKNSQSRPQQQRIKDFEGNLKVDFLDMLHSFLQFYNNNTFWAIAYDQGAKPLWKLKLVELGASLFLIEMLFNWNTSAWMYMICLEQYRVILFQRYIFIFQKLLVASAKKHSTNYTQTVAAWFHVHSFTQKQESQNMNACSSA